MTLNWKGKITKILVLLPQGRSNSMPQFSTMDNGHSWALEKKANGIKDMQPNLVASGIFVRHKMESFENSGHPAFQGVSWAVEFSRRESRNHSLQLKIWQSWLVVQDCSCRDLRASLKVVWTEFWRCKPKQTRKRSQDVSRNSNSTGRSGVIGGSSKTTACIGKPNAPKFKGFDFDAICEQNWISPYKDEILPSDRGRKLLRHYYVWWWRMGKAHFDVQKIFSA